MFFDLLQLNFFVKNFENLSQSFKFTKGIWKQTKKLDFIRTHRSFKIVFIFLKYPWIESLEHEPLFLPLQVFLQKPFFKMLMTLGWTQELRNVPEPIKFFRLQKVSTAVRMFFFIPPPIAKKKPKKGTFFF